MPIRPPGYWRLNPRHPLSPGLVFAGLGQYANTIRYYDSAAGLVHDGNHGTLTNMDPKTDWGLTSWGTPAVTLNGATEEILCGTSDNFQVQNHTFACWMNFAGGGTEQIIERSTGIVSDGFEWSHRLGKLGFAFYGTAIRGWYASSGSIPSGWVHVMGQWNRIAGVASYYFNGELDSQNGTVAENINHDASAQFGIGSNYAGNTQFTGDLSDVCLWNRLLSASERRILARSNIDRTYAGWIQSPRRWLPAAVAASGGVAPTSLLYGSLVGPLGGPI